MKLIRLRSIANNAIREAIWTPEPAGIDPFYYLHPKETVTVNLVTGEITPEFKDDDVERFYKAMSKWFHQALEKEGIPLDVIESAVLIIEPEERKCIIKAGGSTFYSKPTRFVS